MKKWKKSTALFIVLMIVALSAGCAKKIDKVANIEAIITGAHLVMMGNSVHVAYHKKGSTGLIDDNKFAEIIRWVYLDVKDQPNKTFRMPLELAKTVGLAEVSESENDILIQLPENQGAKQAKLSCQINKDDPNIYQVMSLVWGSVKLGSVNKENVAGPRIPDKFLGLWTETGDSEELVDELSIQPNEIEWTRTGEDKDIVKEYTVKDNGETVGFESKITYSQSILGGQTHKSDIAVEMKVKGNILTVEIGGMQVQEEPGITVTRPPETHQYKKVVPQR